MKMKAELAEDTTGRQVLAGVRATVLGGAGAEADGFTIAHEVRKPVPAGAKSIYFLEATGPGQIDASNTVDYIAAALANPTPRAGQSFLALLGNHVLPDPLVPLLVWTGTAGRHGVLAAGKSTPRGGIVTLWDPEAQIGPDWSITAGVWARFGVMQDALAGAGVEHDDATFAEAAFQLAFAPEAWPS
ncbi:hypothetical protein [Cellulomonas bogoriensis]|uniref:Uncharacterized protein n=1 Tax=Cellulomonas bogoriensis 69B4 = DSM 16987 TaxID=1386082 RepID=A0A0A0C1C0_9CELL|nr:hypothetical protein [Cellulomonas bogoriensis]KGM14448.1 hypothetical protein N869_11105 [Cellulomonas bogoriensis 69B4 = DSM 16987]